MTPVGASGAFEPVDDLAWGPAYEEGHDGVVDVGALPAIRGPGEGDDAAYTAVGGPEVGGFGGVSLGVPDDLADLGLSGGMGCFLVFLSGGEATLGGSTPRTATGPNVPRACATGGTASLPFCRSHGC